MNCVFLDSKVQTDVSQFSICNDEINTLAVSPAFTKKVKFLTASYPHDYRNEAFCRTFGEVPTKVARRQQVIQRSVCVEEGLGIWRVGERGQFNRSLLLNGRIHPSRGKYSHRQSEWTKGH